jgi:integrase
LSYVDRVSEQNGRFLFNCRQKGHPLAKSGRPKKFLRAFARVEDLRTFIADHDRKFHARRFVVPDRLLDDRPTVERVMGELVDHIEKLAERGKRDQQTVRHYELCAGMLVEGLGATTDVRDLTPSDISDYIHWRETEHRTQGSRTLKELRALNRALKRRRLPQIDVPVDDIDPVAIEKRIYTPDQLKALISHLSGITRAIVIFKLRTGLRQVEIRNLLVSDFDLERKVVFVGLRNKKKRKSFVHAYALADSTIDEIRPYIEGRKGEEFAFLTRGSQIRWTHLEPDLRVASRLAGITPRVRNIGVFRSHVLTASATRIGLALTSRAAGHRSEATTAKYLVGLLDPAEMSLRQKFAAAVEEAFEIGNERDKKTA